MLKDANGIAGGDWHENASTGCSLCFLDGTSTNIVEAVVKRNKKISIAESAFVRNEYTLIEQQFSKRDPLTYEYTKLLGSWP